MHVSVSVGGVGICGLELHNSTSNARLKEDDKSEGFSLSGFAQPISVKIESKHIVSGSSGIAGWFRGSPFWLISSFVFPLSTIGILLTYISEELVDK